TDFVDSAVGKLGAAVAGIAGRLGRFEDLAAAFGFGRQAPVGVAERIPGVFESAHVSDQRLDIIGLGPWTLHALGERFECGVVEALLPAMPCPWLGLGDAAKGRHFLATSNVERAQVLSPIVERVEVETSRVPVAVTGVATVPLVKGMR